MTRFRTKTDAQEAIDETAAKIAAGEALLTPLQQELADITGMTPVHLNRCLKELRDSGLVTFRNGRVDLHDLQGLRREAQFDPAYLHIGPHEI